MMFLCKELIFVKEDYLPCLKNTMSKAVTHIEQIRFGPERFPHLNKIIEM